MALAVDATSHVEGVTVSGTPVTVSHTCTGSNLLLYVCLSSAKTTAADVIGATYNSVALTQVANRVNSLANQLQTYIFRLINPATGSHTLAITTDNATGDNVACGIISLSGGDQTSPESATGNTDGISSPITITIASAVGELVLDAVFPNTGSGITPGAGQTAFENATFSSRQAGASYKVGAASVTMSWTITGGNVWTQSAVSVKPFTGGGGGADEQPYTKRTGGVVGMLGNFNKVWRKSHQVLKPTFAECQRDWKRAA